ncbi:MAG: quinone-dependent dihydroorotate dehydrogenase, partial [Pseudomonadota bacterium]
MSDAHPSGGLLRALLFRFEPETAHRLAIQALKLGLVSGRLRHMDTRLSTQIAGLNFPNPIGVAAGFDKDAEVFSPLLKLGFGFTEVGTITPKPQAGNPKPRVFRLIEDDAVINRLGFNNGGHGAALARLSAATSKTGIVGVNIGANKDSEDRVEDYVRGIGTFYDHADYFTVNVSSPNTPGLRDLQTKANLVALLDRVTSARAEAVSDTARHVPIFLKIAPDIHEGDLDDICTTVLDSGLEGMIVSNTTLSRAGLRADHGEQGGLSGRPLFERSTIMLAKVRTRI